MNKKIFGVFFVLIMLMLAFIAPTVQAQGETPEVIDTTIPVDAGIVDDVNAWLASSAPVPLPYWAITYAGQTHAETGDTFVSVVAIDLADPDQKWYIYDENVVVWMGSVIVHSDHSVEVYSDGGQDEPSSFIKALAAPLADGGGGNVRFPWDSGASMMYGTRGIHAAGGGGAYATGFSAVDFLGGDDLGAGVASDRVYAVATGEIDYVCEDGTTVTIRTQNAETDDYYIYAHLMDNLSLIDGYTFYQGDFIGSLRHGTFDDTCGWASQTPQHYHLHFGFKPSGGFFRIQNCILKMSSQDWTCGSKKVATGQFLKNNSTPLSTGDDASAFSNHVSFWDLMLVGATGMWDQFVVNNLPDHTNNSFLYALYNGVGVAVRVARVIVYSNVNLGHLVSVAIFGLTIKGIFAAAEFIVFLFKAWKSLIPVLGA